MNQEQGPFLGAPGANQPSLIGRILGTLVGLLVLAGAFVFSVFLFAALAVVGVVVWGFVWWKTREVRKQMRAHMEQMQEQMRQAGVPPDPVAGGDVIEGEFVREDERNDGKA
ncbi:MAG: hypothetical protein IT532_01020 [Burkholderiales bacterium]|nr:hypothetical protein [Burkholderiales bacterium]